MFQNASIYQVFTLVFCLLSHVLTHQLAVFSYLLFAATCIQFCLQLCLSPLCFFCFRCFKFKNKKNIEPISGKVNEGDKKTLDKFHEKFNKGDEIQQPLSLFNKEVNEGDEKNKQNKHSWLKKNIYLLK